MINIITHAHDVDVLENRMRLDMDPLPDEYSVSNQKVW